MSLQDVSAQSPLEYRTRAVEPEAVQRVMDAYQHYAVGWTVQQMQQRAAWLAIVAEELRKAGCRDRAHDISFVRREDETVGIFLLRDKVTLEEMTKLHSAYLEGFSGSARQAR